MLGDVNLLAKQETGVEIAKVDRDAGECLDQMLLDCRHAVLAQ